MIRKNNLLLLVVAFLFTTTLGFDIPTKRERVFEYSHPAAVRVNFTTPGIIQYQKAVERLAYRRYIADKYSIIPEKYRTIVAEINEKQEMNLPPELIFYLIRYESGWNPNATGYNYNGTHDMGLMQLNSRYARMFAKAYYTGEQPFDPYDAKANLEVGLKHYRWLLEYYTGDYYKALQAYNAGRGSVDYNRVPVRTVHYAKYIIQHSNVQRII